MASLLGARAARARISASARAAQRARELRAAGRSIVELAQGEPDFNTPEHIIEAAYRAMRAGQTHYTPVDGKMSDLHPLADFGRQGVLCLLSDSTRAESPGYTPSERVVGEVFRDIMEGLDGRD